MALTEKQEVFCNKYMECFNASEAYRFVRPDTAHWKDVTIHKRASEWMVSRDVQGRIKELQNELKTKSDITKERLLCELEIILDATISDYVTIETEDKQNGDKVESYQKVVFKDFSKLTQNQLRAIESVKQGKAGIELKLHGKLWTIERICKMLGYDATTAIKVEIIEQPLFGDNL